MIFSNREKLRVQQGTSTNWIFLNIVLKIHLIFPGQRFLSDSVYLSSLLSAHISLALYFFFSFLILAMQHNMWDLSSPTRNWAHTPCRESTGVLTTGPSAGSPLFCSLDLTCISPFPQPPYSLYSFMQRNLCFIPCLLKKKKKTH